MVDTALKGREDELGRPGDPEEDGARAREAQGESSGKGRSPQGGKAPEEGAKEGAQGRKEKEIGFGPRDRSGIA